MPVIIGLRLFLEYLQIMKGPAFAPCLSTLQNPLGVPWQLTSNCSMQTAHCPLDGPALAQGMPQRRQLSLHVRPSCTASEPYFQQHPRILGPCA